MEDDSFWSLGLLRLSHEANCLNFFCRASSCFLRLMTSTSALYSASCSAAPAGSNSTPTSSANFFFAIPPPSRTVSNASLNRRLRPLHMSTSSTNSFSILARSAGDTSAPWAARSGASLVSTAVLSTVSCAVFAFICFTVSCCASAASLACLRWFSVRARTTSPSRALMVASASATSAGAITAAVCSAKYTFCLPASLTLMAPLSARASRCF
mmetsp:Transcript_17216/g.42553  ORF Transcript_17216/g.42553 Transcript_17216/m.42553 type:complete len:212 (+) Transcript_17216:120-755(+)